MIETWWRKRRFEHRLKAYRRKEALIGSSDSFAEFFAWFGGGWSHDMLATMPTWLLETRLFVEPEVDQATRQRIDEELARRRTSRAQVEARLSLAIAAGSMLVALLSWLVK